jgi:hypothetical protein
VNFTGSLTLGSDASIIHYGMGCYLQLAPCLVIPVCRVPGKTPEVYFYDSLGKQVEHMYIQHLSFKDLLALLKARGFEHDPGPETGERRAPSQQPVNALQAHMRNATSPFTRMHRLSSLRGAGGPQSSQPRHTAGTFFGRRMLRS